MFFVFELFAVILIVVYASMAVDSCTVSCAYMNDDDDDDGGGGGGDMHRQHSLTMH